MKHSYRFFLLVLLMLGLWGCRQAEPQPPASRFVQGDYAYGFLPWERTLSVIDITDPAAPAILSQIDARGRIRAVLANGPVVYLLRQEEYDISPGGLAVVDVSNPRQPAVVAELDHPAHPNDLLLLGSTLLISSFDEGITAVEIDPADPARIQRSRVVSDPPPGLGYGRLWSPDEGNTLISFGGGCNFRSGSCRTMVSQLMREQNAYALQRTDLIEMPVYGMATLGDYLYTAGYGYAAAPQNDLLALEAHYQQEMYGFYDAKIVAGEGHLFLTANHRLLVLDPTADPLNPLVIAEESIAPEETYFTEMALQSNSLYLLSQYGLHVIDLSDPIAPHGVGFVALTNG